MPPAVQRLDASALLRAEHAVVRVLSSVDSEDEAYRGLLPAIGQSLGWQAGAIWEPVHDPGQLACRTLWSAAGFDAPAWEQASRSLTLRVGEGLPGRVWEQGETVWIEDVRGDARLPRAEAAARAGLVSAFCFPVRGAGGVLAAIELFATEARAPDEALLATMTSLGTQIGQFADRCRAQEAVRESDARKSAILNAAFDCVVTMDHRGLVVEVNEAAERTFGYRAEEMVGRELASLIVPPSLREAHRRGLARYLASGEQHVMGHPVELPAMRSDGSEFPVEVAITRPELPGPPLFCGFLRDVTERRAAEQAVRRMADEQAALRRVATAVATESDPRRVFQVVTEEIGRLLNGMTSNMIRFNGDGTATVVGGWSAGEVRNVPVGGTVPLDGETAASQIYRTGRPARIDNYQGKSGKLAETLRELGFAAAVGGPVTVDGRAWGALLVATARPEPFPAGAEQQIEDFAVLVAQALSNAQAREDLAASRARLVEAGDAERRRLERNLHDGAQQRLVALALTLRLAERQLERDPSASREALDVASAELAAALDELRELARGIHPAILSERGLGLALQALAARAPVPVEVDVTLDCRLPEPVEAAAYFVVAEALTNVAKYARAEQVQVRVARADGSATVEVADDGVGGADAGGGSGLRGLADRVEALGGRLSIESPPGVGTTVRAVMPC